MVSRRSAVLVIALSATAAVAPQAMAQPSFNEDFTTTAYRDSLATSALWDTSAGELKLTPFVPSLTGTYNTSGRAKAVVVAGDHAYVADGASGLQVLDIEDLAAPTLVGTYAGPPGFAALGVAISGSYAYIAALGFGLYVVDISDPTSPAVVGAYDTSGDSWAVFVAGDHAYVADEFSGLQILDISDPTTPTLAGTFDTPGQCFDVFVSGDHAYLADHAVGGLQVVDISDPTNPTLAGTVATVGPAWGVSVSGDRAYVVEGLLGLRLYDISDPTMPVALGGYSTPDHAGDLYVDGDYAYVTNNLGGLLVFDVSSPTPTLHLSYDTSGTPRGVVVAGEHAFVADDASGLQVVNVRQITTPTLIGSHFTSAATSTQDVTVAGHLAILAHASAGLFMIDITDPTNPSTVGTYATTADARGVTTAGDLAFVASYNFDLQIIDISDPTNPTLVGSNATPGFAFGVTVVGELAFVATGGSGLQIVDVSDPQNSVLIGSLSGTAYATAAEGDLAYVAGGSSGLRIVDISDPANPALVGGLPTSGAFGVAVTGDLAFVADGTDGGLKVIDISVPTNPILLGSYFASGTAKDVAVSGNFAFLANALGDLHVIDVSDPSNPTLVQSYDTNASAVALAGELVFVAGPPGSRSLEAVQVYGSEFDSDSNIGQSLAVDSQTDAIVRARLTTTQTAGVSWELSADAAATWQPFAADNIWARITVPGDELLWRSSHTWSPGLNPTASDLTVDWLCEFGPIASIADVPDDQGGWVRVDFTRSGYDFADENITPVTGYQVYRRVDGAMAANPSPNVKSARRSVARDLIVPPLDGVEHWSDGGSVFARAQATGTFPPGTWEAIGWVAATQSDTYLAGVATTADSTAQGNHWSVYLVTTHTTSPSVWFASAPDSGYSLDNIAPGVPANLAFNGPDLLAWDPAPETDFAYHALYGSDGAVLDSSAVLIAQTIAPNSDVSGSLHPYYHVTTLDHAGNESEAASVLNSAVDSPVISNPPLRFAVDAPRPNPFRNQTTVDFDLPRAQAVGLSIYDVTGRRVRTLARGAHAAGSHQISWDGRGDDGQRVSAGVYFARLQAEDATVKRRLVLLR